MTTSDSGSKAERIVDLFNKYLEDDDPIGLLDARARCLAILAEAEQETATAIEALRVATRERDEALAKAERGSELVESDGPEWTEWRKVSETRSARTREVFFEGTPTGADVEIRDDNCSGNPLDFKGHIRFDGCANLSANCIHLCGSRSVEDVASALRGAYELATEVAEIEGEP